MVYTHISIGVLFALCTLATGCDGGDGPDTNASVSDSGSDSDSDSDSDSNSDSADSSDSNNCGPCGPATGAIVNLDAGVTPMGDAVLVVDYYKNEGCAAACSGAAETLWMRWDVDTKEFAIEEPGEGIDWSKGTVELGEVTWTDLSVTGTANRMANVLTVIFIDGEDSAQAECQIEDLTIMCMET